MQQLGVAVLADHQIAGEAGAEIDRIDRVIREVDEMNRIAQEQIIVLRRRIELGPQAFPAAAAGFGGEHGVGSFRFRGEWGYCKSRQLVIYYRPACRAFLEDITMATLKITKIVDTPEGPAVLLPEGFRFAGHANGCDSGARRRCR